MRYTRVGVTNNECSVYSLFSALIMHVYQMRSSNQSIVSATQHRIAICMTALKDVSKVWLVAKMVHTLFESILGNKVLEERLQKAAGRRHQKNKPNGYGGIKTKDPTPTESSSDTHKRKFEEMESEIIRMAIARYEGHMSEVARRLGIGRSTLYRKLKEFGLEPDLQNEPMAKVAQDTDGPIGETIRRAV